MPVPFSKQTMADLLTAAWEGGSNHWVESVKYVPPEGMSIKELRHLAWDAAPPEDRKSWESEGPDGRWPLYAFLPFLPPSVAWKIAFVEDGEEVPVYLTPKNMRGAASKLLEKNPKIFSQIKSEDWDAGSADAWLQMALFDEVVYG